MTKTSFHRPLLFACALRRYFLFVGMNLLPTSWLRVLLLRLCGVKIGHGCYIGFNVIPDTNYPSLIYIGDNVTISHNCVLIAHTQSPSSPILSRVYNSVNYINIGHGAWIGMNSVLLPGCAVGSHTLVGAGSVVSGALDDSSVYVGNPCRKIKHLD
tara:strand:- start:142 stop:609 length:468 start_codon:yes stop_codon:yes gene_type:complete